MKEGGTLCKLYINIQKKSITTLSKSNLDENRLNSLHHTFLYLLLLFESNDKTAGYIKS